MASTDRFVVSGTTNFGKAFQLHAGMLGGLVTGSGTGGHAYVSMPVDADNDSLNTKVYLSQSFHNNAVSGTIIQALNFVMARADAGAEVTWNEVSGALATANSTAYIPNALELTAGGALTVQGATSLKGTVALGDAVGDTITATGRFGSSLVPSTDSARDIGSSLLGWANLFADVGYLPDVRTAAIKHSNGTSAATIATDGAVTIGEAVLTTADINGGTADNVSIGATTPAAAIVTTLSATGDVDLGDATSDTITATGRFDSDLVPSTDNARDLGASGLEWKDLYLDGTANIDSLVADTADINGGNIDGTIIGAASVAAGSFAKLVATSLTGSGNIVPSSNGGASLGHQDMQWTSVIAQQGAFTTGLSSPTITVGSAGTSDLQIAGTNAAGANKMFKLQVSGGILQAQMQP